jgi:SAM-dependent methyltransferase
MSFFDEAYRGVPPWDIGRPQSEFAELAKKGDLGEGDVIDVGCGTGENAILFAAKGYRVLGIDSSPLAIQKAKAKASQRGSAAEFSVADALHLSPIGRAFGTAIDSGLFHVFSDLDRAAFVESVRSILSKNGRYYMLCFSDKEPGHWGGPRRISRAEILHSFSRGWRVDYIRPAKFESALHAGGGGEAWFSKITKT